MEPLIELPASAKARIKAREAEAEEQRDLVRQAFNADPDHARRHWVAYFDSLRDEVGRRFQRRVQVQKPSSF